MTAMQLNWENGSITATNGSHTSAHGFQQLVDRLCEQAMRRSEIQKQTTFNTKPACAVIEDLKLM
jgi:hypothetical protein